jgi:hypothetical protein
MKDPFWHDFSISTVVYVLAIAIGVIIGTAICAKSAVEQARKDGYIECAKDFYAGKMKVDLIENTDGTREWKWINNNGDKK